MTVVPSTRLLANFTVPPCATSIIRRTFATVLTCAVDDPHWRESEQPCSNPYFDGGADSGD